MVRGNGNRRGGANASEKGDGGGGGGGRRAKLVRCRVKRWRNDGGSRGEKEEERGREVGMLVSESHPLTPVSRRIV